MIRVIFRAFNDHAERRVPLKSNNPQYVSLATHVLQCISINCINCINFSFLCVTYSCLFAFLHLLMCPRKYIQFHNYIVMVTKTVAEKYIIGHIRGMTFWEMRRLYDPGMS